MEQMTLGKDELAARAMKLAHELMPEEHAAVIALTGDLGAGKTTFAQAFARALGVASHVTSPTFVIEKRYPLSGQLFAELIHIDAYRLDSAEELRKLDWESTAGDPKNVIVIEWADRVSELIPANAIRISLSYLDEDTRTLTYAGR
jgi:tRNA threonylcarbamoyladenosine biosynthesis protein TsaE